jgi:hypothetical protein
MKICIQYKKLLALLIMSALSYSQNINTVVKAKIKMEEIEGNVKITGTAENVSDILQSLTYKLSVIKKSNLNDNQSLNTQEGLFTLNPSETKKLSEIQINLEKNVEIIVLLLFYNENKQMIGKDRIVIGEEKKKTRA